MSFKKCIICYSGHDCDRDKKLPRKKKKILNRVCEKSLFYTSLMFMDNPGSCNLGSFWIDHKKDILSAYSNIKYEPLVRHLYGWADDNCEELIIKPDMSFFWGWEHDNGLYLYNGEMPFKYREEPDDVTWAYSETKNIVSSFGFDIENVKSDKDFLRAMIKAGLNQ